MLEFYKTFKSSHCTLTAIEQEIIMRIKIRVGKTRIVVVCGSFAYKFVRIRLFDLICKWAKLEYEKIAIGHEIAYKNLRRHSRTQLITDMLMECFLANYREYHRWHGCMIDKKKYVPTFFTFFYLVNIQERDDACEKNIKFISSAHDRRCGDSDPLQEMHYRDNFSSITGRIIDYGGK